MRSSSSSSEMANARISRWVRVSKFFMADSVIGGDDLLHYRCNTSLLWRGTATVSENEQELA
jgi:hypothetical protein